MLEVLRGDGLEVEIMATGSLGFRTQRIIMVW